MAYAKVAISATSLGCSPWWNSNNSANFGWFMPLTERISEIIAGALNLKPGPNKLISWHRHPKHGFAYGTTKKISSIFPLSLNRFPSGFPMEKTTKIIFRKAKKTKSMSWRRLLPLGAASVAIATAVAAALGRDQRLPAPRSDPTHPGYPMVSRWFGSGRKFCICICIIVCNIYICICKCMYITFIQPW